MKGGRVSAVFGLVMLTACAGSDHYHPAPGQVMHISQHSLVGFKKYQGLIGSTHDGAFALSSEGRAYYYSWCSASACTNSSATAFEALQGCEKYGEKCYIFARDNDIKVDYQVVP